jgi:uncharacterized membrane protein
MESKVKLLGHPIHPMLIVFPLGLLAMSLIFDVIRLLTDNAVFAEVAYWNILAGVIAGLLAAIPGAIDYFAIPAGTRAKRVGLMHGVGNVVVVLLFAISWFLRRGEPDHIPGTLALLLSVLGAGTALFTGWLGGELVDRLGIGVDPGAHPDAPSSLSGEPAARPAKRR